jgi:signal transduction histidine kinase
MFDAARDQSVAFVLDLSDRKRGEEAIRESEKRYQQIQADFARTARISMLGELTASIAHEVNQPLASIVAGGEASLRWLAQPTPDLDEVRELATQVVADAQRASEIIRRVRAMAAGRAPAKILLSLDDVVQEALQFLRHEIQTRSVDVSHFPASDTWIVLADRTQLQQVIVNLIVNAVQAMTQSGSANRSIVIRTFAQDPTTLRCSVEDSGPGFAHDDVGRLFDSFFTTKAGGMGMGLRICRSVIEAHGGRISADNCSSQGGARFFFTLPITGAPL